MNEEDLRNFCQEITDELNTKVFPVVSAALQQEPNLRESLNPAFPFPQRIRIGLLPTHLVVEYLGPEDPKNDKLLTELVWKPEGSVLDFLGIEIAHLNNPCIPFPNNLENVQVFLGEAMGLLGDYLYDVVANPNDLILNGYPDFTVGTAPTFVSNVAFLWSDVQGALQIRRIDFMELFPITEEGWAYHTDESYNHFARFIIKYKVPRYRIALHKILNEFIELVWRNDTSEPNITSYLSEHTQILQLAFGVHDLNPQTELIWQYKTEKPNLQPDFMPVRMDGYADIVEFKLPHLKGVPMVGSTNRRHPSFEIDSALAQIDEYAEWCSQEVNRRWLEDKKGIKVLSPHTYLVIGRRDDFTAEERQKLRGKRNATIFTYCEFVEMARMQLYRIK